MNAASQQEQLGTVSAMAATLADRILMERLTGGALSIAKGEALWIASLALEVNEQPVPPIVSDVLAQFRPPEAANDSVPVSENEAAEVGGPARYLNRLLRPFRAAVSA